MSPISTTQQPRSTFPKVFKVERATLIGRLTRGSTRNIDQVPADWEKFCIVHAGAALTNEHTNDDASNVSFAEGIAELISATAAIAAPTMGNLDGLTPEQKTVGLRMLRVAVLRSRVAASRARDASPENLRFVFIRLRDEG